MKISLNWLREYLKSEATDEQLISKMTEIGIEVEEVLDTTKGLEGFIVGEIKAKEKHPNADKLNVLSVWTGSELLQVVCGAPNCYVGMKSVLALPGTVIPKYGEKLEKGVIRGVESCGMMCAEDELCIGEDHTGIIDLKTDKPAGTPYTELLNADVIVEVEVTPNRPDCFAITGIARDLASTGIGTYLPAKENQINGHFDSPIKVRLEDENCPHFVGRYIRGVKNVESPEWMKNYLTACGLRPISALVDITNYLCLRDCRPLHVFDADKVKGDLVVRSAKDGETLIALDDKEYTLSEGMTVIADDNGAQSIAGTMGGVPTSCDENTVNVFVESAYFSPVGIARTGRLLKAESDARVRFERGVDPCSAEKGNADAVQLILDICGGEVSEKVEVGAVPYAPITIDFDFNFVKKMCGMDIAQDEMERILTSLGYVIDGNKVTVPSWRSMDTTRPADLVEEIVRIHGLDDLPAVSMKQEVLKCGILKPHQKREFAVGRALANAGLCQAITFSFMDSRLARMFGSKDVKVANPIASDLDELRPSLIPNLLSATKRNNDRGMANVQLFEVGPEFYGSMPGQQQTVACAVRSGETHERHWAEMPRAVDVFDAKADALTALASAGAPVANLQVFTNAPSWYHPGRSGTLCLGKTVLANFGEIHPSVLASFGIKERVVACEVYLEKLPPVKDKAKNKALELSSLMPLSRDFAFVMDEKVEASKLLTAIRNLDKELIAEVRLFDVYQGDKLPEGKKSLALEVVIQPKEKTLTDDEIDSLSTRIIGVAGKVAGAVLRA